MATKLCGRKMRSGYECSMEAEHRGRCASTTFDCDGCGKTRRGSPTSQSKVVLGDGTVDDVFDFCFMCSVVEPAQPGYGYEP